MPNPLNSVTCGDNYTDACTISDVFNTNGGWAVVSGFGAFAELQYGTRGETFWTLEQELGEGASVDIPDDCIGIRFRNAVAGQNAVINGVIANGDEPKLGIISLGTITASVISNVNVQHNDVLVGTEPGIDFEDDPSLIWTVTDDSAGRRVKVTPSVTGISSIIASFLFGTGAVTPNFAAASYFQYSYSNNPSITLTLNAPLNPPGGTQTGKILIEIANNGSGTITLFWDSAYGGTAGAALPASVAAGHTDRMEFVWDGAKWRIWLLT